MSYLIVVAHPDDEVLGMGATIYKLSKQNKKVNVCILSSGVNARQFRPSTNELNDDIEKSLSLLGVNRIIKGSFPNIKLNTVPHLELVQFIENSILETKAKYIFTHHPSDLNNDHFQVSIACQAASRLFQRRDDVVKLKELLFMEVLSSTEWGLNKTINPFNPNLFYEVGEEAIDKKIEALSMYRGVMRDYPHPRSVEAIKALSIYRGAQSGMNFAESFESAFRRRL